MRNILNSFVIMAITVTLDSVCGCYRPKPIRPIELDISREFYELERELSYNEQETYLDEKGFEKVCGVIENLSNERNDTYFNVFNINDLIYLHFKVKLSEEQIRNMDLKMKIPYFRAKLSQEMDNVFWNCYKLTELQEEEFQAIVEGVLKVLKKAPNYEIPYKLPISTRYITSIIDNYLKSPFNVNLSEEQKKSLRDILLFHEEDRAKNEQIIIDLRTKLSQEGCNVLKEQHELTELKNKDFQAIRGSVLKILNETSGYQIQYKLPISIDDITFIINERLKLSFNINLSKEQRKYLESFLSFYEYARKKTEQFSQEGRQHRPIELQDEDFQDISNSVLKFLKKFQSYEIPYKLPISIDDITIIINECLKSASNINLSEKQKKSLGDILLFYEDTRKKIGILEWNLYKAN